MNSSECHTEDGDDFQTDKMVMVDMCGLLRKQIIENAMEIERWLWSSFVCAGYFVISSRRGKYTVHVRLAKFHTALVCQ